MIRKCYICMQQIKKYFVWGLGLCFLLLAQPVEANEQATKETTTVVATKEIAGNEARSFRYVLDVYGMYGLTYPNGEIAGDSGQKALRDYGYAFGVDCGYLLKNRHFLTCGLVYEKKDLVVERSVMGSSMKSTYTTQQISLLLGYQFIVNNFYGEGGLFYALQAGSWEEKIELDGKASASQDITGNNEAGVYLGGGYRYWFGSRLSLLMGVRAGFSFLSAIEDDGDKLKSNTLFLKAGISYAL